MEGGWKRGKEEWKVGGIGYAGRRRKKRRNEDPEGKGRMVRWIKVNRSDPKEDLLADLSQWGKVAKQITHTRLDYGLNRTMKLYQLRKLVYGSSSHGSRI